LSFQFKDKVQVGMGGPYFHWCAGAHKVLIWHWSLMTAFIGLP